MASLLATDGQFELAANPFIPTRTCIHCREDKPITQFYFLGSKLLAGGERQRASYCKPCNHLQMKVASSRRKNRLRDLVREAKIAAGPCVDCGVVFPPVAMDFDHVRGIKKSPVSHMVNKNFSEQAVLDEIAKCDLRCANCHRIRHHGDN